MVGALSIPSYLSFENERGSEAAGIPFLAVAALGASIWALSLARACRALARSHRCLPREAKTMEGEGQPVLLLEGSAPLLGLAGVLRPRVVISRKVAVALDAEQLSAAIRHEWAHCASRDNLKRLLLLVAPEPLPGFALFQPVDRAWARFAEWAADDRAVGRDPRGCVSLAEALVRVARLGSAPKASPLVSPFVPEGEDISLRVERLLNPRVAPSRRRISGRVLFAGLAGAPFAAAAIVPGALGGVHQLLEQLMH
jgi:beta-lactamase regulating signal transducer with metallopeptidase domain